MGRGHWWLATRIEYHVRAGGRYSKVQESWSEGQFSTRVYERLLRTELTCTYSILSYSKIQKCWITISGSRMEWTG